MNGNSVVNNNNNNNNVMKLKDRLKNVWNVRD